MSKKVVSLPPMHKPGDPFDPAMRLLRDAMQGTDNGYQFALVVLTPEGHTITVAGPTDATPESDLRHARLLERFARAARERAKT